LKKAKTNSKELASVTTRREAEREGRESKNARTEWLGDRAKGIWQW